jgi:hypothetical protein
MLESLGPDLSVDVVATTPTLSISALFLGLKSGGDDEELDGNKASQRAGETPMLLMSTNKITYPLYISSVTITPSVLAENLSLNPSMYFSREFLNAYGIPMVTSISLQLPLPVPAPMIRPRPFSLPPQPPMPLRSIVNQPIVIDDIVFPPRGAEASIVALALIDDVVSPTIVLKGPSVVEVEQFSPYNDQGERCRAAAKHRREFVDCSLEGRGLVRLALVEMMTTVCFFSQPAIHPPAN